MVRQRLKSLFALAVVTVSLGSCGGGVSESVSGNIANSNAAINLPRTGQTTCYDATGNVMTACSTTTDGQDGALQKGAVWPSPRFTVGTGPEADCVTDNLTGLMWAKTPDSILRNWQTALNYANGLVLCGHNDWHLPNKNEIRSLVNYGAEYNVANWLNTHGFSNVMTVYWSSTTSSSANAAFAGDMNIGGLYSCAKTVTNYVWPVRANIRAFDAHAKVPKTGQRTCYDASGTVIDCINTGQDGDKKVGVDWPTTRFTVRIGRDADCVTDNLTGLTWAKSSDINTNWQEALNSAAVLDLCGYTDWRLPNVNELNSLVHSGYKEEICGGTSCATNVAWLNTQGFNNIQDGFYWSSTTRITYTTDAFGNDMYSGGMNVLPKTSNLYVLPVRGGQ